MQISGRPIGPGYRPYIVAELSANHLGGIERAFEIMQAAKDAGADAVKLQTYTADTITIDCDGPDFVIRGGLWDGRRLYELYREAHTPWEWHEALFAKGRDLGLAVFSTPFDDTAVDLLEKLGAPAYKIASFEAVDHGLIERVAATGKPLIISTGMSDEEEMSEALAVARRADARDVVLLHCVSSYPARVEDCNLRTIPDMQSRFGVPVGLSDHTPGVAAAIAATALGACLIEKHVTLRRADGGPDAAFSLEPGELADLVHGTAMAHSALGSVRYAPEASETSMRRLRRSLYVVSDIAAGEEITRENVRSIRPGGGLAPKHFAAIIGRRARVPISRGTAMSWEFLDGGSPEPP